MATKYEFLEEINRIFRLSADPGSLSISELRELARTNDANPEVLGRIVDEAIRRLESAEDPYLAPWEMEP